MYYIRISGYIPPEKEGEFKMTADSCFARWKNRCSDLSFSKDLINNDLCYYQSIWTDKEDYQDFLKSEDYQVLLGCYRSLGNLIKVDRGEQINMPESNGK